MTQSGSHPSRRWIEDPGPAGAVNCALHAVSATCVGWLPEAPNERTMTPMPPAVLQRHGWTGQPIRLGSMFTVTKGRHTADCELWTHVLGWELRLTSGATLLQSQVCRAQDDVLGTDESWKTAMIGKGWR
jgi:hypothetical protein